MSLRWATVVSQAAGFLGEPSSSHLVSAVEKASCNDSSARSNEPARRMSDATIIPYSSRNTLSSVSRIPDTLQRYMYSQNGASAFRQLLAPFRHKNRCVRCEG